MGNRNLDKIVVIDLEATCWDDKTEQGSQPSEIIEIGACFLNIKTGELSNKVGYIVRPVYSTVSEFCTKLTSLTQEQVDRGIPFGDACNKMRKEFGTINRVWASYGEYDRKKFEQDCALLHVQYPFKQTHINVKTLLALKKGLSREPGLAEAVKMFGWEFEGTHHRGCDDAWNIAKVLWELIKR